MRDFYPVSNIAAGLIRQINNREGGNEGRSKVFCEVIDEY